MDLFQTLLVTLLTLSVLVGVHEFGHFWVARRCGIKVLRFSIGFGPVLLRWSDKQGTEYAFSAIPLGGYVKMLGEAELAGEDSELSEQERAQSFAHVHPWCRIAIAAAGPLANFILAILVYWWILAPGVSGVVAEVAELTPGSVAEQAGMLSGDTIVSVDGRETATRQALYMRLLDRIGETGDILVGVKAPGSDRERLLRMSVNRWLSGDEAPEPLESLGIQLFQPAGVLVNELVDGDVAARRAGVEAGDKLLSLNGEPLAGVRAWVEAIQAAPGADLRLMVLRDGVEYTLRLRPDSYNAEGKILGRAGMVLQPEPWPEDMIRHQHYGFFEAGAAAVDKTAEMTVFILDSLRKLVQGWLSPKNLSGPITIAKVASDSARYGLAAWLGVLAMLSISLGVMNLLPVPVLDGGHILYALIEWGSGKPLTESLRSAANFLGVLMVLSVMVLALYNDVMRLW